MSEFYPTITRPLRGARAFKEISETASQPQAAILLLLARQLRGDDEAMVARAKATRSARRVSAAAPGAEDFPIPKLKASRQALGTAEVQRRTKKAFGFSRQLTEPDLARVLRASADTLYKKPTVDTAAGLLEMCLAHPRQLVRIAAAHAYLPITDDPARCIRILVAGTRSADRLERELAATALARVQPEHPALRRLSRRGVRLARVRRRAETIMLVHGTWASDAEWYKPNGSFHGFIKPLRADLYGQADFFRWTGGYSDGARNQGALDLKAWVDQRNEHGLDLMGHSHGANVMMLATKFGLTTGKLVLLSCPVHVNKYFPDFTKVTKPVVSVRVKLDLVILADQGGQRFRHPDIKEIVLPIWFDHGTTHEAATWQAHNIAARIPL
jgi:pimeloyl-ACP methyl ester carboxylesterase